MNTSLTQSHMKKSLLTLITIGGFASQLLAASGGKEVTLEGTAQCAKCVLKEGTECQTTLTTEKNGKKTTYYLAKGEAADKFHDSVCKGAHEAKVTAVCNKVGDKLVLTVSKAEVTK